MSEYLVRDMNTHVRTRICNLLDVEREDGKDARLFGEKIGIEKPNINVAWFGRGKGSPQPTGTFLTFWEKFNPTVKRLNEIMFEMERYDVVNVLEKEYTYLIPGTAVNCYPRDFYYHPRRTIDEHISKIEKGRLHIVHGPIGTGKYSAAMQYIENSERKFSVKWRIDCSQDDESIHEELTTDLAEKLRLKSGCPLDHLFEAIKGRARKENVIFLLENLEPKNHQGDWLKKLWRVKGCVYIIATSSNSNLNAVFSGAQMVNVSDFNEAVGFLKENKQIEKDNSDDDLNELCKYYGWNALGITNAKKYIGLTGMCAKKYLKMIRNKTANLKRRTKKSEDQQIYLSVRMVLEEVDNEKFRVIAAISLIGYENIPDFLLSDLFPSSIAEERTSDLNDLVTDSPFLKLLKPIRKENNIRLLSCQTYTQTVIKEFLDRDRELRNKLIHKMAKILMRYFNKDNRHYFGGFFQRILFNHAEIFLKHCQNIKDECTLIAIARLLDVVSFAYTQSRQPEIVLRNHCERAENIIHQICGIVPDDFQAKSIKPDLDVLNLGIRCNDSDVAQQLFQKLSIKSSQLPGTVIKELAFLRPISSNDMELFPPEVRNDEDLKETVDLSEPLSPHNLDILVSNRVAYSVKDYAALFLPELYASLLYSFGRNYFYLNKQSICDVQFYITRLKLAYCISKEISKCMKVGEAVMHEYLAECNALLYLLVNKEDVNSEELKPKEKSVHCQDLQNAIKCYKDLSVSNKTFFEMGILKKKGDDTYSWLVCQQQIVSCYLKLMSLTSGDERNGYIITCSEYCGVLQNRLVHDANSVRYSPKYFNIVGEFYLSTEDDQFLLPAWRVFYISAHDAVEKNLHGPFYAKAVVGMANVLSRLGKQFFIAAKLSSRMLSRLLVENLDEDPPFAKQFQEIGDRNKASFVNHLAVLWRKKAQNKDDQNTDQNVLDTTAHLSSCQISDPMTACNSNTSQGFEKNTSTYQSTTDRMLFIAERIPRDWKTIARYLGLPDYKIDALSFLSVFAGACFVIWFLVRN